MAEASPESVQDTAGASPTAFPRMQPWRSSFGKRLLISVAYPVFLILNRPSLAWLGHGLYDFALRCNGIAINFPGKHGLTAGEERFVSGLLKGKEAGVLLDVGANNGAYTRFLKRVAPRACVYAFEPHPVTFAKLHERSPPGPGLVLINMAVSDVPGTLKLYDFAEADGSTQASLDERAVSLFSADVISHDVECTTIDIFMAKHAITSIQFLKIDTEGFDINVLRGACGALAARSIEAIQFEFIPANIARRVTMRDFFTVLDGYRISRLCLNGQLIPFDGYDVKRCEIYVTHNLIALAA